MKTNELRRRIMETYKETKNMIKVGDRRMEEFWTRNGIRQGCPMSPTLFNIYIYYGPRSRDEKGSNWRHINEQELKGMMKRFKKYVKEKGLLLSPEKSKVLVFEKGRGSVKKREWKWGEEKVEEVKEIKYLGYIIQKNGGAEKHILERMRRATIAMKQTWSIEDCSKRITKEE